MVLPCRRQRWMAMHLSCCRSFSKWVKDSSFRITWNARSIRRWSTLFCHWTKRGAVDPRWIGGSMNAVGAESSQHNFSCPSAPRLVDRCLWLDLCYYGGFTWLVLHRKSRFTSYGCRWWPPPFASMLQGSIPNHHHCNSYQRTDSIKASILL
jgi:hypothetical protein